MDNIEFYIWGNVCVLLQMVVVLIYGVSMLVVKVVCIVGQYVKFWLVDIDVLGLWFYCGDMINGFVLDVVVCEYDLLWLVWVYVNVSVVMNLVCVLILLGLVLLYLVYDWNWEFVWILLVGVCYEVLVIEIDCGLWFMSVCGVVDCNLQIVEIYVSYEVLVFDYECVMLRLFDGDDGEL